MKRAIVLAGAIGGTVFALLAVVVTVVVAGAAEITELPQGPNRDLVLDVCRSCHDLQMVFDAAGSNRDDWDRALDEMTDNGMNISAGDRAKILAYLSTYLGPAPPKAAPAQ